MSPCAKQYLTPWILQALHFETVHNFSLLSSVFCTCMLYMVYSDINCFPQKKSCGQCQIYLQLTRRGTEAEEEETRRGSYWYTQDWVQKNLPTSYSFSQTGAPRLPHTNTSSKPNFWVIACLRYIIYKLKDIILKDRRLTRQTVGTADYIDQKELTSLISMT